MTASSARKEAASNRGRFTLVDDTCTNVRSAKIEALFEQLGDVIAGGHRALVFSQFTGFSVKSAPGSTPKA